MAVSAQYMSFSNSSSETSAVAFTEVVRSLYILFLQENQFHAFILLLKRIAVEAHRNQSSVTLCEC